jgi:hypothetical protein
MALDRTAFNALIDGTTVWNKTQIKNVILDPVDAELALAVPGTWSNFTPNPFGSQNGSATLNNITSCKYMALGKILFVNFYINITTNAATTFITMKLPTPFVSAVWDQCGGFWSMNTGFGGVMDVLPNGGLIYLMRDVIQTNTIPAGTFTLTGSGAIAIQ